MSFDKYIHMLISGGVFFPFVHKLGDPFEGSLPRKTLQRAFEWLGSPKGVEVFDENIRKQYVVYCWHEMEHESEAMWRLYAGSGPGVAIRTNFQSLINTIFQGVESEARDFYGRVEYVDYETTDIAMLSTMPVFCKRKSFSHEHEVRIARIVNRDPERSGEFYRLDLDELIHDVVLSPFAEDWALEVVNAVTRKFKESLMKKVKHSEIENLTTLDEFLAESREPEPGVSLADILSRSMS
ncbi:MAG: DUF2971 domain-containing protein [Gemmatimonadota bacterium]|nr:DUF2971 domain-containing protein [Gemmatimonadota bacterium]